MKTKKSHSLQQSLAAAIAIAVTSGLWTPPCAHAQEAVSKIVLDGKRYSREEFRKYCEDNPGLIHTYSFIFGNKTVDDLFNILESADPVRKKYPQPIVKKGIRREVVFRDNLGGGYMPSPGSVTITIDEAEQVAISMQKSQDWNVSATVGGEGLIYSASVTGSYGEVYSESKEQVKSRSESISTTIDEPSCEADTYLLYMVETPVTWELWDLVQAGEDVGSLKVIKELGRPSIKQKSIPARTQEGTEYPTKWSDLAPFIELIRESNPEEAYRLENSLRLEWARTPCAGGTGYWIFDDYWQVTLEERKEVLQAATKNVNNARNALEEAEKHAGFVNRLKRIVANSGLESAIAAETKARNLVAEAEQKLANQQ